MFYLILLPAPSLTQALPGLICSLPDHHPASTSHVSWPHSPYIYTYTYIHDAYIILFNIILSGPPIFVLFQFFFRVK